MADYLILKKHFDQNQTHYYTFHPKAEKPIKAVIRHLPGETPAEDIANELLALGYKVHNVRQMTSTRQQAGGSQSQALPLFVITLERNEKSQQIFKLTHLSHIIIQVEAYRARTGLTQCYNCQQFGHVWANCKQPPRCLWCGGGHRHKECPEKENNNSSPSCCNCKLTEGERPHPANYRGCKLAKEEMLRRKSPPAPPKNVTGRTITSRLTNPSKSYAAALMINTQQSHPGQPTQTKDASGDQQQQQATHKEAKTPNPTQHKDTETRNASPSSGQSVQANTINNSLNDMFKVATIVQQIMTELNGAVTEEQKIVAITKIVLNLMKENGH